MPDDRPTADFQQRFGDGGAVLAQSRATSPAKNHRLHLLTLFVTQAVSLRDFAKLAACVPSKLFTEVDSLDAGRLLAVYSKNVLTG